jgi:hypothetical protein
LWCGGHPVNKAPDGEPQPIHSADRFAAAASSRHRVRAGHAALPLAMAPQVNSSLVAILSLFPFSGLGQNGPTPEDA